MPEPQPPPESAAPSPKEIVLEKHAQQRATRWQTLRQWRNELLYWLLIAGVVFALYKFKLEIPVALACALALLPGALALANYVFVGRRGFDRETKNIGSVAKDIPNFDKRYPVFTAVLDDLEKFSPQLPAMLLASLLLSTIFLAGVVVGNIAKGQEEASRACKLECAPKPSPAALIADSTPTPTVSATPETPSAAGSEPPTATASPTISSPSRGTDEREDLISTETLYGFVFAIVGAYIQTLLLMIGRLNSTALSPKFLYNSVLRSAIAGVLGLAAAQMSLFKPLGTPNQVWFLYFATGLFPIWALQWLREKIRTIFAANEDGCRVVPICLVDGLDDGIIERLAETGLWDIQHLATVNPIELTVRTLYPLPRVLDWVHQAILINFIGNKITVFRELGVRGAIDLAVLYGDSAQLLEKDKELTATRAQRATALLDALAQRSGISKEALHSIGRLLFADNLVSLIWELSSGANPPSPLQAAMSRKLRDMLRSTAIQAAAGLTPPFNPDPPSGTNLALPVDPAFETQFTTLLDTGLQQLNLKWNGTIAEIRAAKTWDEMVEFVSPSLELRP